MKCLVKYPHFCNHTENQYYYFGFIIYSYISETPLKFLAIFLNKTISSSNLHKVVYSFGAISAFFTTAHFS